MIAQAHIQSTVGEATIFCYNTNTIHIESNRHLIFRERARGAKPYSSGTANDITYSIQDKNLQIHAWILITELPAVISLLYGIGMKL